MSPAGFEATDAYCAFNRGRLPPDPYPLYRAMREGEPVHWCDGLRAWVLTRYDDVLAANRDARFSSGRSSVNMGALPPAERERYRDLGEHVGNWLGFTDPPKNTRMRNLVAGTVTSDLAERLRQRIARIVAELLEALPEGEDADLLRSFAYPLPATVICEILGIPEGLRSQFRRWVEDIAAFVGGAGPYLLGLAERADRSRRELSELFRELVRSRRARRRDDLLTTLADAQARGHLSETELLGLCVFLFAAGHETTVGLIASGIVTLLGHPDQLRRLRAEAALMPSAVEELVRYEPPIQQDTRLLTEDVTVRGRRLERGQTAILGRAAANRDPLQFDGPEQLDLARAENRHLGFGWGIHFCLGAPLARVEASIALMALFDAFPRMELITPVEWWDNLSLRCPRSVMVDVRQR